MTSLTTRAPAPRNEPPPATDKRASRWAFAAGGVVLAVVAIAPTVWHQLNVRPELRLVDLDVYRSAGESVLIGRPVYGYLTPPPQLLPFTYPPLGAVLAVPLALLPWLATQWVWTLAQVAVLVGVVRAAFGRAASRFGGAALLALGAAVAAMSWLLPVRDGIRFGQVDVLLLALCLADCVSRRPRWPRGLLIGLATAVKLTPAVFIPYLWLTGRRRAAGVAAGTAAVVTLLVALLLPFDSWDYWTAALWDSERLGRNTDTSNQSLRGMILRAAVPHGVQTLWWLVAVAVVAWVGFRRARDIARAGDELAAVAVVGLLAVLLSPVAWIHHLAWVVLVVAVVLGDADRRGLFVAAVVGVAYALPLPWWGQTQMFHHNYLVGVPLQNAYGLLAVVLVLTLRARPHAVAAGGPTR